ncbi:hypothetical protein CK516_39495 [Nostoc sp. 'Peltigera malacea cyanobiont' DB3992]|nr:hypothetical protein CK516_39495 [Nostoc sp. 'Peltigera malacea cyanobiont' DB3992]
MLIQFGQKEFRLLLQNLISYCWIYQTLLLADSCCLARVGWGILLLLLRNGNWKLKKQELFCPIALNLRKIAYDV